MEEVVAEMEARRRGERRSAAIRNFCKIILRETGEKPQKRVDCDPISMLDSRRDACGRRFFASADIRETVAFQQCNRQYTTS